MNEQQNEQNEYQTRLEKLETIRELGVRPYADKYERSHTIQEVIDQYSGQEHRDSKEIVEGPHSQVQIAGRVMLYRTHGKISFAKLQDQSETIQLMLHKQSCTINIDGEAVAQIGGDDGVSAYKFFAKYVDVGDFVGVDGEVFETHKGELTVYVKAFTFLSKSLKPMGDKWHGVTNKELLYRQRYIDTTLNKETRDLFLLRSKFLKTIRDFYDQHEFVEVETPVLGHYASGAAAEPFVTHHNDMDIDMYLRISPETALKKLTAGMFEKVFEVAKDFRNEGSDPSHHQEFTMIEHYAAYWDYKKNMDFTEEMFGYIFEHIPELDPNIQVTNKQGETRKIDFSQKRERINYIERVTADTGIDIVSYGMEDEDKLRQEILDAGHKREGIEHQGTATLIDYLYKKVTRPQITGPAFIYNYPKTMQPLARTSDENPHIVEQRQLVINGWEVIKAYSELVDPIAQKERFEQQAAALAQGDKEATKSDDDFLQAMEYGMPPQSGRGMGIDRILTILTEQDNIRDVIYFPMMKPLE